MKKLALLTMIAFTPGLFQGCKNNKGNATVTIDSLKKDSSTMTTNVDTAFANKAAVGGMAEVALGKLALTKTSDAKIKGFANMMIIDHGKANTELMGIAKAKHITLPTALDAGHRLKMDSLSKLSGMDFNKAYVNAMIDGHQKTLALMQDEANNGKEADLRAFATQTVPIVKMHLDTINKINKNLK
jgi:putative membrane protein